jgi:predicted RNase H-like HicB family nuclease
VDTYEVDLEAADSQGFAVTVPALPGLLVFGATIDEVLARARASIAFHVCAGDNGQVTDRIALVPRTYVGLHPLRSD